MSSPLSRSHLGSASPLLVASYKVMSQRQLMPLSHLKENPWRPSASVGEARDELQGTVDDWLARELPTTAKDDRDHGANFLRAAVKQFDRERWMEDFACGLLEDECKSGLRRGRGCGPTHRCLDARS